jgi:hypothetical protein
VSAADAFAFAGLLAGCPDALCCGAGAGAGAEPVAAAGGVAGVADVADVADVAEPPAPP